MINSNLVICQFGLRTSYDVNSAKEWNTFFSTINGPNTKIFDQSLSFTLDYWMRLPNKRIEFYPNISFRQAKSNLVQNDVDLSLRQVGIGLLTHVYILDLVGDCDCPTFSKQGTLMKKGLFLLAGTGVDYSQKAINQNYSDGNIDLKIIGGVGFDIGVNDLFTFTPFIQYQYYPDISWHDMAIQFGQNINNVNSSFGLFQLGVRMGFRPDYK
jgi:hypothetical protein